MRTPLASGIAALCFALAASADDTRPPQISDVRASARGSQVQVEARITDETGVLSAICHHRKPGGKVEDSAMTKNDLDDVFRISFAGGPDTEYWIEASDLLGNGPALYGSPPKAFAVGGTVEPNKATAKAQPPPKKAAPPPRQTAKASEPPAIQHSRPSSPPAEGKELTVRTQIRSDSPIGVAVLQARPQGGATVSNTPLRRSSGDNWEAQIPASMARGTVEYFIAAKNQAGQMTRQGDGDARTPFAITFKGAAASSAAAAAPAGPFVFSDDPPARVPPGRAFVVRVQVVPPAANGDLPDRVAVLWRGNDAQDQMTDMVKDETGGWGGFKAEIPAQDEGAVFFQIV